MTKKNQLRACLFRKRHPEITLHYTRFKFPVLAYKFPVLLLATSQWIFCSFPIFRRHSQIMQPVRCLISCDWQRGDMVIE